MYERISCPKYQPEYVKVQELTILLVFSLNDLLQTE